MMDDDLDRILSRDQEILPSSAFVVSVMDVVRREAMAPPPIPFPWKAVLPGLCGALLALASLFFLSTTALRGTATEPFPARLTSAFIPFFEVWKSAGANWIALALVLSFASVKLSKPFVSGAS